MVKASQIDWACHDHSEQEMLDRFSAFHDAINSAWEFAKKDQETLLLVTGDHETGSLSITGGSLDGESPELGWTTGGHTAIDVPLYAYGPGAERFSGTMDNTDIGKRIANILGIETFPIVRSK